MGGDKDRITGDRWQVMVVVVCLSMMIFLLVNLISDRDISVICCHRIRSQEKLFNFSSIKETRLTFVSGKSVIRLISCVWFVVVFVVSIDNSRLQKSC